MDTLWRGQRPDDVDMRFSGTHIRHVAVALATVAGLAIGFAEPAAAQHTTTAAEVSNQSAQRLRDRSVNRSATVRDATFGIIIWV